MFPCIQDAGLIKSFEVISIGLVGSLPRTSKWILSIEDNYSRWVELLLLHETTPENCSLILFNKIN